MTSWCTARAPNLSRPARLRKVAGFCGEFHANQTPHHPGDIQCAAVFPKMLINLFLDLDTKSAGFLTREPTRLEGTIVQIGDRGHFRDAGGQFRSSERILLDKPWQCSTRHF